MEKKKYQLIMLSIQWILIIFTYALLWNRIRFGIDFTDESWYVAEPYIVAKGAIPYVNNWTQAPGFVLPLAIIFKFYVDVTGGTEGIIYFSRMLYAIVAAVVYGWAVFLIWRKTKIKYVPIMLVPLLFLNTSSLYDLNYDTMGVMYLFLSGVLLFFGESSEGEKGNSYALFSGVIMARGIIASPSVLAAWGGSLFILITHRQWRRLIHFLAGNTIFAVFVMGWCCIQGSVAGFINGMRVFLTKTAYFQVEQKHFLAGDIKYLLNYCKPLLAVIVLIAFAIALFKLGRISAKSCKQGALIACALCLTIGVILAVHFGSYTQMVRFGWFNSIVLTVALSFLPIDGTEERNDRYVLIKLFAFISILYLAVYLLTSSTNIYGFGSREYWLIIPVLLSLLSYGIIAEETNKVLSSRAIVIFAHTVIAGIILMIGGLLIYRNYSYVYRDSPVTELITQVDCGIWKGIYTTPERAENVKSLERYIHDITNENDEVLFLDQVCFAYLMNDGKACTPTSSDAMMYSYHVQNTGIMEEYFNARDGIMPNKIIYIDFGRDEKLSIDDADWYYNYFVEQNYMLKDIYDTNPLEEKHKAGQIRNSSFFVKYYEKK